MKQLKRLLHNLFIRRLSQDLGEIDKCNLSGFEKQFFADGYSNGFVKGFFYSQKWIIGILIILIISMIFNFILYI